MTIAMRKDIFSDVGGYALSKLLKKA